MARRLRSCSAYSRPSCCSGPDRILEMNGDERRELQAQAQQGDRRPVVFRRTRRRPGHTDAVPSRSQNSGYSTCLRPPVIGAGGTRSRRPSGPISRRHSGTAPGGRRTLGSTQRAREASPPVRSAENLSRRQAGCAGASLPKYISPNKAVRLDFQGKTMTARA